MLGWIGVAVSGTLAMIGLVMDVVLMVYKVVEDLESALLVVLLMSLLLRGVLRDNKTVKKAIEKKNVLRGVVLDVLGGVFKRNGRSIQNIIKVCRR